MKITRLTHYISTIGSHPEIVFGPKKYLFLISHMRSFSTLISHLLGSSPEINGYKENHLSYSGNTDLLHLRYRTQQAIEADLKGEYVLDKILHNHASISGEVLKKKNLQILFTIRKPVDTVKSIMNMGNKLVDVDWYRNEEKVAAYYESRLEQMCNYAALVGKRGAYIDAEAILNQPDEVVENLSEWLHLKNRLTTQYETFKHTGEPFHGDPSKNILKGKIMSKRENYDIEVSPDLQERVNLAYQNAKATIQQHCPNLGGGKLIKEAKAY